MAALVQSYPQQSGGTVTMLQTRPSSSGMLPSGQGSSREPYLQSAPQIHRNSFHGMPANVVAQGQYRGGSSAPIQPYAFTNTPSLTPAAQWQPQYGPMRTTSSPSVPTVQSIESNGPGRPRYFPTASMPHASSSSMGYSKGGSRDDSSLPPTARTVVPAPRPQSSYMAGSSTQLTLAHAQVAPFRASPDRYRRPAPRFADSAGQGSAPPSGSGMATISHLYNPRNVPDQQRQNFARRKGPPLQGRPNSFYGSVPGSAVDDIQLYRQHGQEEARRFRRRSMHTLDSADYPNPLTPQEFKATGQPSRKESQQRLGVPDKEAQPARVAPPNVGVNSAGAAIEVVAFGDKNGSTESVASSKSSNNSRPSSAPNRSAAGAPAASNPASLVNNPEQDQQARLVNIPPRNSSADASKRIASPSPLSQPVTMGAEDEAEELSSPTIAKAVAAAVAPASPPQHPPSSSHSNAAAARAESPAVRQLAAINQKGTKLRSKTSRLRRAFSFGSAAEFRKASNPESSSSPGGDAADKGKEPGGAGDAEGLDEESARVAQQQEEAGIGSSIYAGARIFSGSTDNLSISSTASSASIMIRKMGRGLKRGSRSLVGLFRPKSMIGSPDDEDPDSPSATSASNTMQPPHLEPTEASVSMVTVEAERQRVNVNPDPHAQAGGGTGFPHLERNSMDATTVGAAAVMAASLAGSERGGSSGTDSSDAAPRKSIIGGENERAEVLAAVRKGILKHTAGSSSPSSRPADTKAAAFDLPNPPSITESPTSSAPSTPNEESQGHKRTGSVAISSEDYFVAALRLNQDNSPGTPKGGAGGKRCASFSPRIIFYDTWPSGEYDRRGEIATCNRLTPMLAQQIKEELNTFKMEMEVHENSKIYTHFF